MHYRHICDIDNENISVKLWTPFYYTLNVINKFRLEDKNIPELPENNVKEFTQLNKAVTILMKIV